MVPFLRQALAGGTVISFRRLALVALMLGTFLLSFSVGTRSHYSDFSSPAMAQTTRNPWLWPFSENSIWNLPIGSGAKYSPAKLPALDFVGIDLDLLFVIPKGSPVRALYDPGSWEKRCQGQTTYENLSIALPDDLIVADAINAPTVYSTPNNAAALLQPDGRTIIQLEPMTRCVKGGPVYGYRWPKTNINLYGLGTAGSHLGSGLSAIGGTIRKGELTGSNPIRHALKIELWEDFLSYNPQSKTPGYRWPAELTDGAASSIYKGKNSNLVMGSLLALSPTATENSLGLTTGAGKKLFHALQDYGAYQVDTTGQATYAIAVEPGVTEEFQKTYGYAMEAGINDKNPYYADFIKLMKGLQIITNNQPTSIGGGGTRRAALAPPIKP